MRVRGQEGAPTFLTRNKRNPMSATQSWDSEHPPPNKAVEPRWQRWGPVNFCSCSDLNYSSLIRGTRHDTAKVKMPRTAPSRCERAGRRANEACLGAR